MKISVIIPTFQRADILAQTLKSLGNQTLPKDNYEVIVVDDGSNDNGETKRIVKQFGATYLRQTNQGQGVARNTGVKQANNEIILLIGDDQIPANPKLLEEHLKVHQRNPEENVAVLGFTDWHPDLKVNNFMQWLTNGSCVLGKYGGHQFAYEKLEGKTEADYNFFYTSNISLKRSLLLKEEFDTDFGKYGWEDIELGYRLTKKHNLKLLYNPNAIVWHHHIITEDTLAPRMRMIAQSARIIDRKYPELNKIPSKKKILAFKALSSPIALQVFKLMSKMDKRWLNYFYYSLSKKYYLEGLERPHR